MKVFALKSCDTCRKAIRMLQAAGHEPEVTDVRDDGVSAIDLDRFLAEFGDDLINRRSTTWRNLDPVERAGDPRSLLVAHPILMKRPVIESDGQLFLGWGPEVRATLLG